MARIGKARTEIVRSDPEYTKWIKQMSRLKSVQENEDIRPSRITQAIFNLRNVYPIDEQIKRAKLGKWKSK